MRPAAKTLYRWIPFFIAILCVLTRLPQLLSNKLILDGDECVVAIMARNIYTGKDFPIFFYGQAYGFSLVETLTIVLSYSIFGISTISVKLAMLSLWTTGVIFLYKTLVTVNKGNAYLPLLLTLIFIFSPAWAVWSMKARGGYLTSFLLSSVSMYITINEKFNKSVISYILLGILLVLIYQSQPIWLAGFIPILVYTLIRKKQAKYLLSCLSGLLVFSCLFYFLKQGLSHFHEPAFVTSIGTLFANVRRIPIFLFDNLHGNYFFSYVQNPNLFCVFFALLLTIAILVLPLIAIYRLVTGKRGFNLFIVSVAGILLALAGSIFIYSIEPRYLLPVLGFAMLSLQLLLPSLRWRKATGYAMGLIIVVGAVGLITFYDFSFCNHKEKDLKVAIAKLKEDNILYLFCADDLLGWQVMFYSGEEIIYRGQWLPGRYPPYINAVNKALDDHKRVAVFGDSDVSSLDRSRFQDVRFVAHYYYGVCSSREQLVNMFYF